MKPQKDTNPLYTRFFVIQRDADGEKSRDVNFLKIYKFLSFSRALKSFFRAFEKAFQRFQKSFL